MGHCYCFALGDSTYPLPDHEVLFPTVSQTWTCCTTVALLKNLAHQAAHMHVGEYQGAPVPSAAQGTHMHIACKDPEPSCRLLSLLIMN